MAALLDAALEYLARGWSIIPVMPGDKRPLVKWERYQKERAEIARVRQWWDEWPNANVGIVTGKISGLTVIDADGPEGAESATRIHGLPETRSVKTPKGHHLYFAYNPAFHTGTAFLPGIDARNDGGYVVAPPSEVAGKPYAVIKDIPVASLTFTPAEFQARHRDGGTPATETDRPAWVTTALTRGAIGGTRNDTATRLAGYLHSKGHPLDVVRAILDGYNARCQPPLDTRELDTIVASIGKYPTSATPTIPPEEVPQPQFYAGAGSHVFDWPTFHVRLRFAHLREHSDATTCELALESIKDPANPTYIYGGVSFNLTSARTRSEMAKLIEKRWSGPPWATMLEQACPMSLQDFRKGEPCVEIGKVEVPGVRQWVLWPIIAVGHTTVVHGPGGSGKSTWANLCALCIEQGESKAGLLARPGKVLYLDWENSEDECRRTVAGLQAGLAFKANPTFRYRRCYRPLAEDADAVQDMITTHNIAVIIVDGATYAAGGEKAAKENAGPVFQALRSFGTSNLIIHHEAKDDLSKSKTAYGSVFWREWARHVFEIKANEDDGGLDMALFNRKSNLGRKIHPLGYRISWDGDAIMVKNQDVRDVQELAPQVPLASRIEHVLAQHGKLLSAEITAELQADAQQVSNALGRMKKSGRVQLVGNEWFLVAPPSDS